MEGAASLAGARDHDGIARVTIVSQPKRNKRTLVVGRSGKYRFQTGLATAALLNLGLSRDEAFAASSDLRDSLRGVETITTNELKARIHSIAEHVLGRPAAPSSTAELPSLRSSIGLLPFSSTRLLRSAVTAGLDADSALKFAHDIERELLTQDIEELDQDAFDDLVGQRLESTAGQRARARFDLTRNIRRSKRPVFILIGGATGTGKSSLATELAFRLGIRHVTSTDMVREAMRAVLSREVVPGLHDHSFRGMALGGQVLSDPRERVLAGYRQQADQVAVGLRAVLRRAARENSSMVIEGTHLRPPFRRYVPPEVDGIVAGIVLAVPEEEVHRRRFPARAVSQPLRRADDYLDSFQAVRWIHDDLLAAGEEEDSLVIANDALEASVDQAIEVFARTLRFEGDQPRPRSKLQGPPTLFLILDGLADEPSDALGGRTPLDAAETPTLDLLAQTGGLGQIRTGAEEGHIPETDEGLMALLAGPDARGAGLGRGMLEALGLGMIVPRDAIVFRGNFATRRSDGELLDRRAGRIRDGTADLVAGLHDVALSGGLRGSVRAAHEHRVVVMLRGPGLSALITDTDPGSSALVMRVQTSAARNPEDEAADRTAAALNELLEIAGRHLAAHPLNIERRRTGLPPANCLITRGASAARALAPPIMAPTTAAMVAGCSTAQGVARAVGLQPVHRPGMTANLDTDLDLKFAAAAELLDNRRLVVIHLKGTDIAAHDRRPLEKRDYIERVDAALARLTRERPALCEGLRIVLSADHGTSSRTGDHLDCPVPLLVAHWSAELAEESEGASFHEGTCEQGALGLLGPGELHELLWVS